MPRRMRLPRRTFLRGLGGVAVALPALEIMAPRRAEAFPDEPPKRYFLGFAGISTGGYLVNGQNVDAITPATTGTNWEDNISLAPISTHGLRDDISVVSNLLVPWETNGNIPAGGRHFKWHSYSMSPLLSGVRSSPNTEAVQGITSDQVVANQIGGDTLHQSIQLRVQAAYYRGNNGGGGARGRISYGENATPLDPITNPQLAFQSLFTGFVPPDPAEAAKAKALLERRSSVLDLVAEDTEALLPQLGSVDKQRMERHLDEIRGLENRLSGMELPDAPSCMLPENPGADWPIGGAVENGDTQGYESGGAYSNEQERAEVLTDIIAMSFICDITRVSSLMYTFAQCFLNANPLMGMPSDMHEIGHFSMGGGQDGTDAMGEVNAWHVDHFARLVKILKDTPDVDGQTVLDHTALLMLFEGGVGWDPEGDRDGSSHSSERMVALIGGHAGGLNPQGGTHISAGERHPVEVVNTAMRAVGVDEDLGEVSGHFDELLG